MLTQAGFTQQEAQQAVQGISDAQTQPQPQGVTDDGSSLQDTVGDLYNGAKEKVQGLF